MASHRSPGPLGVGGVHGDIRDGTLARQVSPRPGPTAHKTLPTADVHGQGHGPPADSSAKPPTLVMRNRQPDALPVLRAGSRGEFVRKLQILLNNRLVPSPNLTEDGNFGPLTGRAVLLFQRAKLLDADQVVGKYTWYHLLKGEKVYLAPEPAPVKPPTPAGPARFQPPKPAAESIWEWPVNKKILAAVKRVPGRLGGEARREWDAFVTPEGLALTLVIIALFCLLSGGTALVLGFFILGVDVCLSLAEALITASHASDEKDLDEAADLLAHIVLAVGVVVFLHGVGKIAGRIKAKGSSEVPEVKAPKPTEPEVTKPTPKEAPPEKAPPEKTTPPKRETYHRADLDAKWYDSNGNLKWPPNDGFEGPPKTEVLQPGTKIDRYGLPGGKYLSPDGTPYGELAALPYDASKQPYTVYEVAKPLPVKSGPVAPWFDEPGGGTQYMTDKSVGELVKEGYLRPVKP